MFSLSWGGIVVFVRCIPSIEVYCLFSFYEFGMNLTEQVSVVVSRLFQLLPESYICLQLLVFLLHISVTLVLLLIVLLSHRVDISLVLE